ncbi:hypothetical protein SAMN05192562_106226 [Kosakonia arachidis]|uniref:Pilin (Type 1 fimbria component protein) n=1 Tax=Kosakonia arachidis TaxID=551989 RepID=A0A1I7DT56_9ENTR|nr:hypothetical protein [Kosakonia arachidis]SFU14842.1 hypothetical protein SAMN05192562_106226 [Kosakonia arachidis]
MKNVILRALASMVLLAGCAPGHAATMDITASFSPSMDNPENNAFTNTTPQSGYCKDWPSSCAPGVFSIELPLTTTISKPIVANDIPRNSPYFALPNKPTTLTVTNTTTGETAQVAFRVTGFSARYTKNVGQYDWENGSFMYPNAPCSYSGASWGAGDWYHFLWKVSSGQGACYKISTIDRTEPSQFFNMSIAYEIVTPDPLKMESGIYQGTLPLSVGPGGDFDFGDNYQASDTELTVNFTLTVNHELKLTTTADNQKVSLQPCALGKVCTDDEGQANWERWMVNRITPELTGRSNFSLSSSGAFSVYLECEQQSGSDCALKSDNTPSQTVPVQTLLTLPDNIVDNVTGSTVSKRRLAVGKDVTKNVFATKSFGQNRAGSIDFLVGQKDVDTMLKTRPDTYRGAVTVIFDPKVY